MNLAISNNFAQIDFADLVFPAVMKVDWVRIYQPKNAINIGCDPKDFPTAAYINEYVHRNLLPTPFLIDLSGTLRHILTPI